MPRTWTLPPILTGPTQPAADLLACYFTRKTKDGAGPFFSGSRFERLLATESDPNAISAADLLAVTMLRVNVPAPAALRMLGRDAPVIAEPLRTIPDDVDLADVTPDLIGRESRAWGLWRLVDNYYGMGTTLTSKVLARKRPRLLPVQDTVVSRAVGHQRGIDFWAELRRQLGDDGGRLRNHLEAVRSEAQAGDDISIIRVFDIVVWMAHRRGADDCS